MCRPTFEQTIRCQAIFGLTKEFTVTVMIVSVCNVVRHFNTMLHSHPVNGEGKSTFTGCNIDCRERITLQEIAAMWQVPSEPIYWTSSQTFGEYESFTRPDRAGRYII